MHWLQDVAHLCGGAAFVNAVPHVVNGVMGHPFQTPFARPRGPGRSSSILNVAWGCFNLLLAYGLLLHVGAFDLRVLEDFAAFGLGFVATALFLARRFGRFNGGDLHS